jgi:hypothetical protein
MKKIEDTSTLFSKKKTAEYLPKTTHSPSQGENLTTNPADETRKKSEYDLSDMDNEDDAAQEQVT